MGTPRELPVLTAECDRCFGLCCVLLPFAASSGFGVDKPGGTPCHHLAADDRCTIHATLRESGWPGCASFDCFGAGQQVSQVTYGGVSWRDHDDLGEMAAVLSAMRQLHEMLAHLDEVIRRSPDAVAEDLMDELVELGRGTPEEILGLDLDELRERVGEVLDDAVRRLRPPGRSLRGRDLAGHDLRGGSLADADLRGALLIAADLREEDLGRADLLGADLRDTDVRGAALADTLFLTQPQVNTARGDRRTTLPADLRRPSHWS